MTIILSRAGEGDCKVDVYVNANYGAVHNFSRGALSP
jgi:hypothetical protein